MKVPLSWIKDYVEITLPIEDLAHEMTMGGLEVEEIRFVGLAMPENGLHETKVTGLSWDPETIVVGEIREVMPHPNADRLVLCRLYDGQQEHTVLTGAPNLFEYKGRGLLEQPLKVAYAKEGAQIYDGHQPGQVLMTLKRAKIRGVESYSMACSEKELGISDEHEGIIILDDDAPAGMPLADYMGDAVLDIAITPNIARDANVLGVAREIAALTGQELRKPDLQVVMEGESIRGRAEIEIREPELNPRFVLGLVESIELKPSPYWAQRRLRLAGMRPINNVVDATNYAMLELGEPLHAFDYDVLRERAGGEAPTIITRTAEPGETLRTLDDVGRQLDDYTVLVCDTAGPLSIAGVMGGEESEVSERTRNVLLEGAAWNFINIRRTLNSQHMSSEAAYRFSRGVHPAMSERGVRRCLELLRRWSGGVVADGLIDNYPLRPVDPTVEFTTGEVRRWLGIDMSAERAADLLERLEFEVEVDGERVRAKTPDHRLDIGEGIIGVADVMEEIARIYGYERIPETRIADPLPSQRDNVSLEREERLRDLLAGQGLQEVITYRMTAPASEARLLPPEAPADERPYLTLENPIASDKIVLRHSLLNSLLEVIQRNARLAQRQAIFEIGPVFLPEEGQRLPAEVDHLVVALSGPRDLPAWQGSDNAPMDFYDLKGILSAVFEGLKVGEPRYEPCQNPSFHPGKCARLVLNGVELGVMGELHPLVKEQYEDMPDTPILAADLLLQPLLAAVPDRYEIEPVSAYPPALEDLAVIVGADVPADRVEAVIRQAGGERLAGVRLFDVYRGEQVGEGKKSLAYSLAYQAPDHTLSDQEVLTIRNRIIRSLERELDAQLRS